MSCNHLVEQEMTLLDITKETAGQSVKEIGEKLREEAEKMEADAEIKTNKRYFIAGFCLDKLFMMVSVTGTLC